MICLKTWHFLNETSTHWSLKKGTMCRFCPWSVIAQKLRNYWKANVDSILEAYSMAFVVPWSWGYWFSIDCESGSCWKPHVLHLKNKDNKEKSVKELVELVFFFARTGDVLNKLNRHPLITKTTRSYLNSICSWVLNDHIRKKKQIRVRVFQKV